MAVDNGPGSYDLQAAGARPATLRVQAVALGRFDLIDGRPADTPEDAAEMAANFTAGTVPILNLHGGFVIGWIESLTARHADLHFTGEVSGWPDLEDLIHRRPGVSLETVHGVPPGEVASWGGVPGRPLSETHVWYRGTLRPGLNLIGLALSDRPAARGSLLWIVRDD